MPVPLLKAHQQLDRVVDRCYRPEPFPSDRHRVEYLFVLYEKLTAPLVAAAKPARRGRRMQGTEGRSLFRELTAVEAAYPRFTRNSWPANAACPAMAL
jgi:hypothetical protein